MGGSEAILDASSREPLPAGQAFLSLLRAAGNRDRAARGIRDFILRYPDRDDSIDATVVLCGIGDRSTTAAPQGTQATFLQGRGRHLTRGSLSDIDPRIGEGEMSTVHFVVNYGLYVKPGVQLTKWLVIAVDTDQWMLVLLAMGTGRIPTCGQSCVDRGTLGPR